MTTPCTQEDRIARIETATSEIPLIKSTLDAGFEVVNRKLERVLGNGEEGLLGRLDRRVGDVERREEFEARVNEEVESRISAVTVRDPSDGMVRAAFKATPPWAWFVVAFVTGPKGIEKLIELIKALQALWK